MSKWGYRNIKLAAEREMRLQPSANVGIKPTTRRLSIIKYQICSRSPSVAFLAVLSSSLNATPDSVHMFCLFKNTCFLLSFPRALCLLILSLSPSFLPAHFLPPRPLPYSHFHTVSLALFGDACHFSCGFLTPAQDMKGLFCVYGRMGTGGMGKEREKMEVEGKKGENGAGVCWFFKEKVGLCGLGFCSF